VTIKLLPGVPSLRTVSLVQGLERSFAAVGAREDFRLVHYSLQDTHAHLIVEARDAAALGRGMMAIGARIARAGTGRSDAAVTSWRSASTSGEFARHGRSGTRSHTSC